MDRLLLLAGLVLQAVSAQEPRDDAAFVQMRAESSTPGYVLFEQGETDNIVVPVTHPPRIHVAANGSFMMGSQPVALVGANYVVKAKPYFPPLTVVRRNAQSLAEQAQRMAYRPTDGRKIVPFVRLGVLMEGAMPNGPGPVDIAWASKLDRMVRIFAEQGVYVILDNHQRAFCASTGGFGLPWWMAKHMQDTTRANLSFIASQKHTPHIVISDELVALVKQWNLTIPVIENDHKTSWDEFSAEGGEHPELMSILNKNMRLNNHERAGDSGQVFMSHQVQNFAIRLYGAHASNSLDQKMLHRPLVDFVIHLAEVWQKYTNVIAVEMLSEPYPGGLPNMLVAMTSRPSLYSMYEAILQELEDQELHVPLVFNDVFAGLPGANAMFAQAYLLPLTFTAVSKLSSWAMRGRLIFNFNYVPGTVTMLPIPTLIDLAKKAASQFGCKAVLLSEFSATTAQSTADTMGMGLELGLAGVAYAEFVDTDFTGTPGWFKYPSYVGRLFDDKLQFIPSAWPAYKQSVLAGEYWGAEIWRCHSGMMNVLELMTNAGARRHHAREEFLPPKGSGPASG